MRVSWKLLYDWFKKIIRAKKTDDWDDNPFVVL